MHVALLVTAVLLFVLAALASFGIVGGVNVPGLVAAGLACEAGAHLV